MLVSNILEKTNEIQAWKISANKLADKCRDIWLDKKKEGAKEWAEQFSEDSDALPGLREEGFDGLVGIDYVFKWWGSTDSEALAGQVDVIWKVADKEAGEGISCYRSWIKFTDYDFVLGLYKSENDKRSVFRESFRDAFAKWKELFNK